MRKLFAALMFASCALVYRLPVSAQSAPPFVQGTYSNTEWGGGPNLYSTISDTFTSNTAAGDTIIAVVQNSDPASVTGCTDNVNGTPYVKASGLDDTAATQSMSLWYLSNINAGMPTVTCTFSSPSGWNNIAILEYKGLGSLDAQTSGYNGSATSTLSLGPISTTVAGDLVIGAFTDTNVGHWSFSQGSGYTTRVENGSVGGTDVEDMTQATAGSVVATGSISPADTWMGVMVAFKPNTIGGNPAATPVFSPVTGAYSVPQSVTITDATAGATIYYTTDGSTPTTSSSVYSTPIAVSSSETVNAIATAAGYSQSLIGTAAYTISGPSPAATPVFSPTAGTYSSPQSAIITDTTAGATIYYTTDGTTPTTASSVYGSPISISVSETLKAIATATGYSQSAIGSASYTITAGSPGSSSVSYVYDSLGRLYQAQYTTTSGTITVTYSYDADGNRTSVVTQ